MRLKFKHQQFQLEAVNSIINTFKGQPNESSRFTLHKGIRQKTEYVGDITQSSMNIDYGFKNHPIKLLDHEVLANIQKIQREHALKISERLEGRYNLTVEMETGTGKTYTYIRTMYELYKNYGWSKFIIVVPSIAIREGVLKTFQITEDHFMGEFGTKARYFVYNSKQLHHIEKFSSDAGINVMIINSQAFAARGQDARRIYMELDDFNTSKPIDVIASVNPILIIDEPQSVEGQKTKESLKSFNPLFTLRYSATHREDYNKVYRLDALDAYNMKLVKKISVKGISVKGTSGTESFLYLEGIDVSNKRAPVARIEFEVKTKNGLTKKSKIIKINDNLYRLSENLEQYKGYIVSEINGLSNSISFMNGVTIHAGEVQGDIGETHFRRIQIRETIKSHFEKERIFFDKGIKVLSLFFIDEVAKYRQYNEKGIEENGSYAKIFEEEYLALLNEQLSLFTDAPYIQYLKQIQVQATHKGYFSIDKKTSRMVDPKVFVREKDSDDTDAYDLIMRDKEQLLSFHEPTRFIFSHSALREGWDNPNVFQICTLKHSESSIKKRQEVGRGLRLCVNQYGDRMDSSTPGIDVHEMNVLTVIASESYEQFAKQLQNEIAETLSDRPRIADPAFFLDNERNRNIASIEVNNNFYKKEFQDLWSRINKKSIYTVKFDSNELIKKCISILDAKLDVPMVRYAVKQGEMNKIQSKDQLKSGESFETKSTEMELIQEQLNFGIKYDLIGKLMDETRLTRKTVVAILSGIKEVTYLQFRRNPEEFIIRAAKLINEQKSTTVIESITYNVLNDSFEADIFTQNTLTGQLGQNAISAKKHIYDYVLTDSKIERAFAKELDVSNEVQVYAKLPRGFFIPTPLGNYNPDWAIVFKEGSTKHIYFIAETKGSLSSLDLRPVENAKIECARKHFAKLNTDHLKYDVVNSYEKLMEIVK